MAAALTAASDVYPPPTDPSLTNPGLIMDSLLDDGHRPSPTRHQVLDALGGVNDNMKVLHCIGLPVNINYKKIYRIVNTFGSVDRIRLSLSKNEESFDCYVVFLSANDAKHAYLSINGNTITELKGNAKLYDIRNFSENDGDFIPKNENKYRNITRKMQLPVWHVVSCKADHNNVLMARECLEDHIGEIHEKNITRYGKNLLVKAQSKTQAKLLTTFTPEEDDIVSSVSPHRSFNTARGVVFSRDLYEYNENDILRRCPEEVLSIKKLKGKNGAIQLTFHSSYLPDYIKIAGISMTVKKFKQRPTQCHKCFEYGHVESNCPPERSRRCFICSETHDLEALCKKDRYCFLCQGPHSPNWKECPVFLLEKEVLEVAANDHVSIGVARRRVKPWNAKKSYASAAANNDNNNMSKNRVPPTKASKTSLLTSEAIETPATPAPDSSVRPKEPVVPSRKKHETPKPVIVTHQLTASQLEIHEAPSENQEISEISPINESSQSAIEETTSVIGAEAQKHILASEPDKALDGNGRSVLPPAEPKITVQPDTLPEPLTETLSDVTLMESEISRTKRSRSSSPPTRTPNISTSNRFSALEKDESVPSSSNTSKPSKRSEGTAKDASTKKSKLFDKASKIKKPKIKSLFNKPLLSRSAHLAAGELPNKVRK